MPDHSWASGTDVWSVEPCQGTAALEMRVSGGVFPPAEVQACTVACTNFSRVVEQFFPSIVR